MVGLGSPSKVYGYLEAGKPIIAIMPENTDIVKDVTKYENGFHIKNGDYISLKNKLIELSEHTDRLVEMAKNSTLLFNEKYTLEKCANKYLNLIKTIGGIN